MESILTILSREAGRAFEKAGLDAAFGKVTLSNRPDLCEYQCNGAMAAAKTYHRAPLAMAEEAVAALGESPVFADVQAVRPGFINLKVNGEFLADYLNRMQADEKLSVETVEKPKTIKTPACGASAFGGDR